MAKEDVSNKTVLILALLVVLVVIGSSWLVLNKLHAIEQAQSQPVIIEENMEIGTDYVRPEGAASISFSILPRPGEGE